MPEDQPHKPLRAAQSLGRRGKGVPRHLSEEARQQKAELARGLSARLAKEGKHPKQTLAKMKANSKTERTEPK